MRPARPDDLLAALDGLGIAADTHHHPAVFTVAESAPVKAAIAGAHSKNLFLKDRKGRFWLVVAKDDTAVDLKRLHQRLGAASRLSFGSADLLRATLGVEPGSVTPFAAINDTDGAVSVILDARLMRHDRLNFHPLVNTMTTGIARADLVAFLRSTGHEPQVLDLEAPPEGGDCMAAPPPPS